MGKSPFEESKTEHKNGTWDFVTRVATCILAVCAMVSAYYSQQSARDSQRAVHYAYLDAGRLVFAQPNLYHIARSCDDVMRLINEHRSNRAAVRYLIIVPVSVANTGAVVHVVTRLRGRLVDDDGNEVGGGFEMYLEADRLPLTGKGNRNAVPFPVPPRSGAARIVGFQSQNPLQMATGAYTFRVEAYVDGSRKPTETGVSFRVNLSQLDIDDMHIKDFIGWFLDIHGKRLDFKMLGPTSRTILTSVPSPRRRS